MKRHRKIHLNENNDVNESDDLDENDEDAQERNDEYEAPLGSLTNEERERMLVGPPVYINVFDIFQSAWEEDTDI